MTSSLPRLISAPLLWTAPLARAGASSLFRKFKHTSKYTICVIGYVSQSAVNKKTARKLMHLISDDYSLLPQTLNSRSSYL